METGAKLYVGCSLTHAPEQFREGVQTFKNVLRGQGHELFDFIGLVDGTDEDVYRWDIGHCVRDCDMFVAICDYPSTGLGWEMCEATRLNKPVLALAHEQSCITRLVLGAAATEPNVIFERYATLLDAVPQVSYMLTEVTNK